MSGLMKNEKGFSLIEVMIAIALLGVIGIAILGGLATASRALFVSDEQATAESLARNQMEYVKKQPYAGSYSPQVPQDYVDDGYSATINATSIEAGLQRIRVTVYHQGNPVTTLGNYTLEAYKEWR